MARHRAGSDGRRRAVVAAVVAGTLGLTATASAAPGTPWPDTVQATDEERLAEVTGEAERMAFVRVAAAAGGMAGDVQPELVLAIPLVRRGAP